MTVEELIEELKKFPPYMIVMTRRESWLYNTKEKLVDGVETVGDGRVLITSHEPKGH